MNARVLLIGGTSHAGKTSLGERVARNLGWRYISTDNLSRHPGRPWPRDDGSLPEDVIAYYSAPDDEARLQSVLDHYTHNVWPIVDGLVRCHLNNPYDQSLVLEGSALLPPCVDASAFERTRTIWLTAPGGMIRERIEATSSYEQRDATQRALIDAFIARALAFDRHIRSTLQGDQRLLEPHQTPDAVSELVTL